MNFITHLAYASFLCHVSDETREMLRAYVGRLSTGAHGKIFQIRLLAILRALKKNPSVLLVKDENRLTLDSKRMAIWIASIPTMPPSYILLCQEIVLSLNENDFGDLHDELLDSVNSILAKALFGGYAEPASTRSRKPRFSRKSSRGRSPKSD